MKFRMRKTKLRLFARESLCRHGGGMEIIMKGIYRLKNPVYIVASAACVGHEESEGPLGNSFDIAMRGDDTFGMDSWEKAESELVRLAVSKAFSKSLFKDTDTDIVLAGDLINQCIGSFYGIRELECPVLGLYGACSTAAEGLLLSALLSSAYSLRCLNVASSHYATAERQFRSPLEYGGQRPPTSQWTVTGAGAFAVSSDFEDAILAAGRDDLFIPKICEVLPGRIVDAGVNDANNMGAAMAPGAADTLCRYFEDGGEMPDMILTGDLGYEGTQILRDIMASRGREIDDVHADCGLMIYDIEGQDKHAGGSGCGCSAAVLASSVLNNIRRGELSSVVFVGTGALMNTMSLQQGESIMGIAHLVRINGKKIKDGEKKL